MVLSLQTLCLLAAPATVATTCAAPVVCEQPPATYVRLQEGGHQWVQWNTNGGFCGSFSFQTVLTAHGAWVSQDLVRKANVGAPCFGHGNGVNSTVCTAADDAACISSAPGGCEVGPENYAETCRGLRLDCDVWDYMQPSPQTTAYKAWLKTHLAGGVPIVWAPMLPGASNLPYGNRSCPNGGHFNHHEPILGIASNHSLDDARVYDEDWLVHMSDYRTFGSRNLYYRTFGSLEDGFAMDGNCGQADPHHSPAYPCFYDQVTYGVAVKGFDREATLPVSITVSGDREPLTRDGAKPLIMSANVTVRGLAVGEAYALYRYAGVNSFPAAGLNGYESKIAFTATADSWRYEDPVEFPSNSAVYYIATVDTLGIRDMEAAAEDVVEALV